MKQREAAKPCRGQQPSGICVQALEVEEGQPELLHPTAHDGGADGSAFHVLS